MAIKKQHQNDQVAELVNLVRDLVVQQNDVLKVAMQTQHAQAEVLSKWLGMFTPQTSPLKSTSEEDRIQMREQYEAEDWEPATFGNSPFDFEKDLR